MVLSCRQGRTRLQEAWVTTPEVRWFVSDGTRLHTYAHVPICCQITVVVRIRARTEQSGKPEGRDIT